MDGDIVYENLSEYNLHNPKPNEGRLRTQDDSSTYEWRDYVTCFHFIGFLEEGLNIMEFHIFITNPYNWEPSESLINILKTNKFKQVSLVANRYYYSDNENKVLGLPSKRLREGNIDTVVSFLNEYIHQEVLVIIPDCNFKPKSTWEMPNLEIRSQFVDGNFVITPSYKNTFSGQSFASKALTL